MFRVRTAGFPTIVFVASILGAAPATAPAQVVPGGDIAHTVVGSDSSEWYPLKSLLIGFPGVVVTVANASVVPAGGVGLGILGVGLGAGQIALAFDGPRYGDSSGMVAVNAVAGVAGILAGLWQIRATHADGATGADDPGDPDSGVSVRLIPGWERAGVLLSWRW